MKRTVLIFVMLLCCVGVAQAEKSEPVLGDKRSQENEPWFNPIPVDHIFADVPESEPGNNACPGQGIACGDVVRPAALTAGDNDYYSFTANAGDQLLIATDADVRQPSTPSSTCTTPTAAANWQRMTTPDRDSTR